MTRSLTRSMAAVRAALVRARRWVASLRCGAPRPPEDPLDHPLFAWAPQDVFTRRDLLRSVAVMGSSGSGKTTGSGRHLAHAMIQDRNIGGLILASKPGDRVMWEEWFARAGRAADLVVFGPGCDHRFNVLDYEVQQGADSRELTQCLMTIGETLSRDGGGNADHDPFWAQQSRRVFHNAIEIVRRGIGRVRGSELQTFIATAALSPAELTDARWRDSPHSRCLSAANDQPMSATERHDFDLAAQFWLGEWPCMNDRTRSSILAGVMGLLHVFLTGVVHDLFGGETTVSPAALDVGRWVLVNMPVASYGAAGAFVAGAWKYAAQRHVLRRGAAPGSPLTCLWVDEYQNHVTSFDATYLAECRSHHGCMVVLTQSLHSFFAAMPGRQGEHQAEALLTNFGTKVFHALGDERSAKYASSLVGTELQVMVNLSTAPPADVWEEMTGRGKVTRSTNTSWQPVLQPGAFLSGLRTGGPANGFLTDAIVVRGGDPFADGRSWRQATFTQVG